MSKAKKCPECKHDTVRLEARSHFCRKCILLWCEDITGKLRRELGHSHPVHRLAFVADCLFRTRDEVDQTLGKALGYPVYDAVNFPGADGVQICTGDHVLESLAMEAAGRIRTLEARCARLEDPGGPPPCRDHHTWEPYTLHYEACGRCGETRGRPQRDDTHLQRASEEAT